MDDRVIAEVPVVAAAEVERARPWQTWRQQLWSLLVLTTLSLRW
jgi:hypothetical protein